MEALKRMITRLRNALADKENQVDDSKSADSDEYRQLDSCKRKVDLLEDRIQAAIAADGGESLAVADLEQEARQIEVAIERI